MSTNKLDVNAVNARAKEEQTPMTKIPSVEERFVANYLDGDKIQDGQMLSSRECLDAITAEREAGAREALLELEGEARLAIVEWENSEDYDHTTNDGLYLFCQTIALKRKALTPLPDKE